MSERQAGDDRHADGNRRARAVIDQQRQQFENLAGIEEIGRIERVAQIHALLAADPGRDQHQRRQDEQPALGAAEQRVYGKGGEREQQDRRPARTVNVGEEGEG